MDVPLCVVAAAPSSFIHTFLAAAAVAVVAVDGAADGKERGCTVQPPLSDALPPELLLYSLTTTVVRPSPTRVSLGIERTHTADTAR